MKILKYLAIALLAVTLVSCGDDEPKSTYTREFTMIYPQHAPGHKQISKIEQEDAKGNTIVATASYDGDHLKSIKVETKYSTGGGNEETINFDYKNGAIICDRSIKDVTYAIEINTLGAITRLKDITTERIVSSFQYNYDNELEMAQTSDVTKMAWTSGNIMQWETIGVKSDSVVYEYGSNAPLNKGGIDIVGNESITFTKFVCAIMRNAGFFGATSAYLPTVIKKDADFSQVSDDPNAPIQLKRYNISYELDSEGYVKSYTTNETSKYTVRITYR